MISHLQISTYFIVIGPNLFFGGGGNEFAASFIRTVLWFLKTHGWRPFLVDIFKFLTPY
jgi:hypothetical protein